MAYPAPLSAAEGDPTDAQVAEFLLDLGARKEFRSLRPGTVSEKAAEAAAAALGLPAYGAQLYPGERAAKIPGLRLHGAQEFVRTFENPDTPYPRLLLNWQTGVGKTIGALGIAQAFVRQFRARPAVPPAERPTVAVLGFTRTIIQAELLANPEFGYVSAEEVAELERLQHRAGEAGASAATAEARAYSNYAGALKRRLTDRARGGYYAFYGYKEFAARLFAITRRGAAERFSVQSLYQRAGQQPAEPRGERQQRGFGETGTDGSGTSSGTEDGEAGGEAEDGAAFLERIEAAVAGGLVRVNRELLGTLRGGLVIADEVHNTYNVRWKNNYGVAIQYALDALEAEGPGAAPRAVFLTATVSGGSAAEVVDLLNLLLPRAALPGAALAA